jgi:hypothetical protein
MLIKLALARQGNGLKEFIEKEKERLAKMVRTYLMNETPISFALYRFDFLCPRK